MAEKSTVQLSLANILDKPDADAGEISHDAWRDEPEKAEGWDEEDAHIAKEGYCIECEGESTIMDDTWQFSTPSRPTSPG